MGFDIELLLLGLTPVFLLAVAWEVRYWQQQGRGDVYAWRDSLCNAALGLMHQGADKLAWMLVIPLYAWVYQHRLFHFELSWPAFFALFVAQDFLYYGFHRASHRVRWLWAAHSVHHSSTRMNFSTAFRQSLMYPVAGMWAFWLPLAWLGFPPQAVVGIVLINLAYQFYIHTQAIPHLGAFEKLFNTPSIHRVHHAKNPRYIDRNFAGVLVVWDRLFGSFVAEDPSEPCDYGTVKPVMSFNPITVSLTEWRDMLQEAWCARHWRDRWVALFGSPEAAEARASAQAQQAEA
ncbi:sterol desaturase family protein [Craterilacuibacter sp. RT1T]|uniref:sterol desaturase family protein n=1 Tax=Craterilacuibacter sp. RT1T TaxID=2942211 RepID=UPI0020BEAE24|nr:sterol desaturase family protein [Craterilacuibacter sp. RT1T]MCL6264134.1 sterol desaturase family protein [Craterilacuibacter sp. RT1T]